MKLITAILDRSYRRLQRKYPSALWIGDESRREIALTFDDGPHPLHTQPVLDTLKKYRIHASFFLLGRYVEQHPQIVKKIHTDGHQIGIHGYRHLPFPVEKSETLRSQLEHTRQRIAEICNMHPETINHIRPPYGAFTHKTLSRLESWGYHVVMWNNIPPHWMQPLSWSVQQTLDQATPGGVIVLHDGHGHGTKAAHILDQIIPALQSQGYDFITIQQMRERKLHHETDQPQHRRRTNASPQRPQ
jgi:peptidoglycan/xylan/chitin deacetylase (PgdA/CDA1 family)